MLKVTRNKGTGINERKGGGTERERIFRARGKGEEESEGERSGKHGEECKEMLGMRGKGNE